MNLSLGASLTRRLPLLAACLVIFSLTLAPTARAGELSMSYSMSYSGRLVEANGAPVDGAVPMEARFWTSASDGSQLGRSLEFPSVKLANGVFTIALEFSLADATVIFGTSDEPIFIEITANGKVYPRQKFSYVPYALRIPVDEQTIKFGRDGKLTLAVGAASGSNQFLTKDSSGNLTWGTPSVTKLQNQTISAAAPSSGQVLKFDGSQWVATNLSTESNPLTGTLPVTDWASPGAIGVTNPNTGSFTSLTASGNVGIGSTAAPAQLNLFGQVKITGGSPGVGKVLTSDATGLASWTTPAVGMTQLADTSVTPGNYTRANITVDQQGRLTAAQSSPAIINADIDAAANIDQSKINGLSASLGAKEPTIAMGSGSQYWRGDKSWATLNTTAVTEGTNQYFTVARAKGAMSALPPIGYSVSSGEISISQAGTSGNGYLSSSDWMTFNAKQDALGFTPINKAGDTLAGTLNMNGQDITGAGNLLMAGSKVLGLSANASDPALSGDADKGKIWFNSGSKELKYFDGLTVKTLGVSGSGLQSFNNQTSNNQTLAVPGTAGTAPNWSSSAGVHTLNIPVASAAGVTAGLISAADYATFAGKVGSVVSGTGVNVSTTGSQATVNLASAGTAGTYTKVSTDAYGRVSSGSTLSASDIPPHAATLITSGELSPARGGTGLSAAPADGQLLIGNGGSFALGTLSAGAKVGVTITSGAGSITLDTAQDIRITSSPTFDGLRLSSLNVPVITQAATTAPALSVAGQGKIYFDQTANEFKISQNGGAYAKLASGGTVTNVATGMGLTGGPITAAGTISLSDTAVTPGSYTRANITVDQQGRLTAAQSAGAIVDGDIDAAANIAQNKISGLSTALSTKEPTITAGSNTQYWRGDKSWQTLNTTSVAEGTNQYFTSARAISSISGSAPITYSTVTGTIGISQASGSANGYLSSSDWTTFNTKQNALGFTPLSKAGDTMAGELNAGGFDLSNSGNIQMANSKTLTLSNNTSDPAGLTAADEGKTWYNATLNQIKYWDGSAAQTLGVTGGSLNSLNNQTGGTQTFGTPGTSGTAPAWTSGSNIHTLNIPLASAAGVTAGLISNSEFSAFSAKVSNVSAGTGIAVSAASGTATVSLASVGTAGTYTKVTTDNLGRVVSGSTLVPNDIPPLSASAITSGILGVANGGTGAATLASNNVLLGNGASAPLTVAPGASGNVLTSNGTTWQSTALPATTWAAPGAIGATTPNSGVFTTLTASGNVGIGTTAPNSPLDITGNSSGTSGIYNGISLAATANPPSSSTAFVMAAGFTSTSSGAYNTARIYGLWSKASHQGSGVVGLAYGAHLSASNDSSGTVTDAVSLRTSTINSGTGTITNGYGVKVDAPTNTGGGSISNYYGLHITTPTVATTNYSIYSTGGTNYLGGNVGIGTTAPAGKLDVAGSICLNGANCITSWPTGGGNWATSGSDSYLSSGKLGLGTSSPAADLSLGGSLDRTIQVDRNTGVGSAGGGLMVQAGGAKSGSSNFNGGTLTLASGVATGTGTSSIEFKTVSAGSSGATDAPPTTKMTIFGNGNVGIGTTTTTHKLTVAGDLGFTANGQGVRFGGGVNGNYRYITELTNSSGGEDIVFNNSDNSNPNAGFHFMVSGGGSIMKIMSAGKVGIGTNLPGATLSLGGTASRTFQVDRNITANTAGSNLTVLAGGTTALSSDKNGGTLYLSSGTASGTGSSALEFQTATAGATGTADRAPTTKMIIDGVGNVGIGTTSPDKQLDIIGQVASDNYVIRRVSDANETTMSLASDSSNYLRLTNVSGNRGVYINTYTADGNRDIFYAGSGGSTAGTPGMIRAVGNTNLIVDGNVGIGTTAPGFTLQVGSSAAASAQYIGIDAAAAQQTAVQWNSAGTQKWALYRPGNSNDLRLWDGGGLTDRVTFQSGGNVGIGTTAPTAALDLGTGSIGMGYEHVVATCPSAGACSVSCSAGKKVLGGGCDLATNAVLQTKPNSTTGWTCTATGTTYMNVWAICARMK